MGLLTLPDAAEIILDKLNHAGFEAYVVGGCVRDSIMGLKPHDWDICTSSSPAQTINIFSGCNVIPTGIKHGTVTVILPQFPNEQYEITTFRVDGEYKDFRHPSTVLFTNDLSADLSRRDFTINAMAYNHSAGLIDIFGGLDDVSNKLIRCVGSPEDRFHEDALRIMRAVRFSVTYGFDIDADTKSAIYSCKNLLKNVSYERINSEFSKAISHGISIDLFECMKIVVPELNNNRQWLLLKTVELPMPLILAKLFDFDNNTLKDILTRLRYDNKTICAAKEIHLFGHNIIDDYNSGTNIKNPYYVRKLISQCGNNAKLAIKFAENILSYETIKILTEYVETESKTCCSLNQLNINGNDLLLIGFRGKQIGYELQLLLSNVIEEKIENDHNHLIEAAARDYIFSNNS